MKNEFIIHKCQCGHVDRIELPNLLHKQRVKEAIEYIIEHDGCSIEKPFEPKKCKCCKLLKYLGLDKDEKVM